MAVKDLETKKGVLSSLMKKMDGDTVGKRFKPKAIEVSVIKPDPDCEVQTGIADAIKSLAVANRAQIDDVKEDHDYEDSEDESPLSRLKKLANKG